MKRLQENYAVIAAIIGIFMLGSVTSFKLSEVNNSLDEIHEFIVDQENSLYDRAYAVLNSDIEFVEELDAKPAGKQDLIAGCKNAIVKARLKLDFNGKAKE